MSSVAPEALARLAAMRRPEPKSRASGASEWSFDAQAMRDANDADLAALGITVGAAKPATGGGQLWELTDCPYSPDHDDSAFRIQYPDGGIHVGCHHDRCRGKTIKGEPRLFPRTTTLKPAPRTSPAMLRFGDLHDHPPDDDLYAAPFRLQTRKASTIEPKDINWIWKPWQPAGMIGLFAGYGGSGKSTVALSIAAACSAGGRLPDGQPAPLVNTLIFAAEDSPEHTIIPRLLAMGADLARIHIVDGISRDGEDPGWVQLRNHVSMIEQAVIDNGIGLVIIDPVSSYIGDANGDKESDVRAGIMPIVAMAERTGAAVLLIRHVSKAGDGTRAASRILGSTAWHDIPRVAWMLADAPDDHQPEPREDGTRDTRRVLGVVKSNLAAKPPARWCIQPVDGPLRWLPDPSPVTVDECFFSQSNQGGKSRDAEEWLKERLAGGSQPSKTVESVAKDAGISRAALKRARASLNVKARKEPTGEWVLSFPPRLSVVTSEGAHPESTAAPVQDVNALHNTSESKGLVMNALNPFPERQAERTPQLDLEQVTEQDEGSKGLNSTLKRPDEPLLTSQREVMELDCDLEEPEGEWSMTI